MTYFERLNELCSRISNEMSGSKNVSFDEIDEARSIMGEIARGEKRFEDRYENRWAEFGMTEGEYKVIEDNLRCFEYRFGKLRVKRFSDGNGFYVFNPANPADVVGYCPNITYLNGWLYGCVQAKEGTVKPIEKNGD